MTLPPLVITVPGVDGLPYGPGFDIVGGMGSGPLPTEQYWEHIISSTANGAETEHITTLNSRTLSFNERSYISDSGIAQVPNVTSAIPHGGQGTLTIRLRTSSTILEQTSRPIVIDWQSGYQQLIALRQVAATGGYTQADRDIAEQTKALASFPLGAWFPALQAALQGASQFPYGREAITPCRTGGGVLTRPGGGFNVNALGIAYTVDSVAPGIGLDEGAPPSYEIPVVELGLVSQIAGGNDVHKDSHWFTDDDGVWIWNFDVPYQVIYWIQPGVTVCFYWLLFNPLSGAQLRGPAEFVASTSASTRSPSS